MTLQEVFQFDGDTSISDPIYIPFLSLDWLQTEDYDWVSADYRWRVLFPDNPDAFYNRIIPNIVDNDWIKEGF